MLGFSLDASTSWDTDALDDAMSFQWTCTETGSGKSCGSWMSTVDSNEPVLHVPAFSLKSGASYNFSVTVTSMIYLKYDLRSAGEF